MMSVVERAERYVAELPLAVSHAFGHKAAYNVALALAWGFALSKDEAWPVYTRFNDRCDPPFSERDLQHKWRDASQGKSCKRSRGWLLGEVGEPRAVLPPRKLPEQDPRVFDRIARTLMWRCPIETQQDVCSYVLSRGLQPAFARDFALPPPHQQAELVATLIAEYGLDTVAQAGLLRRDEKTKEPLRDRFVWGRHRWCIPWVGPDGLIHSLSRRICGPANNDTPRWVVPAGHAPVCPLGIDDLAFWQRSSMEQDAAIVEGPSEFVALRMLCLRAHLEHRAPIPIVLALHSASSLMPGWLRQYMRGCRVRVATDTDAAGEELAGKLMRVLPLVGAASVERWKPPAPHKDWGSLLQQEKAA